MAWACRRMDNERAPVKVTNFVVDGSKQKTNRRRDDKR